MYTFYRYNTDPITQSSSPPARGLLLGVQGGELGQQQAVALRDGLLGGGGRQVALEGQDLLPLPLRGLQLPADHLRLGVLVGHRARRERVVAADGGEESRGSGGWREG